MMREYYIWTVPRNRQDAEMVKNMRYIGGDGIVIGDQNIWTNSEEIKRGIKEYRDSRAALYAITGEEPNGTWGRALEESMQREIDDREIGEVSLMEERSEKYNPGTLVIEEEGKDQVEIFLLSE